MNFCSYSNFDDKSPLYNKNYDIDNKSNEGYLIPFDDNINDQDIKKTPFLFLQAHPKNYKISDDNPEKIKFKQIFFSKQNVKRIQKKIKKAVFNETKGKFRLDADQDENEIFLVMKLIYSDNARYIPGQMIRQIKKLNKKVVSHVLPPMITEIKSEYGYLQEINGPLIPIPRPMNVNNAGRRTLPSITTTF